MKKFVPTEKLSKRAKKELAAARRKTWNVVPVSRKIESKKHYDRKKPYDRDHPINCVNLYVGVE